MSGDAQPPERPTSHSSVPDAQDPAPRPLTRWIWIWLAASPGFYVASFLAAVALDRYDLVPTTLHGPLRLIYFPILFLSDSYRPIRAAFEWFLSFFPR